MKQELSNGNYESISAFLEAVNSEPRNPDNRKPWLEHAHGESCGGPEWYGAHCATGNDVQRKVNDGWPEGRERLNELRSQIGTIELAPQDRRRRMTRSDMGDSLDIHAVYAGRLDIAWRTAKRRNTQGPQHIDLCANMLCSGNEHSDVLFWRGAAATILTDLLESAGYVVRLAIVFGGVLRGAEQVSCRIIVKSHDMPFDVTSVSATLLPGFFRALGHAWIAGHCKQAIYSPGISVEQGKIEPQEILLSHNVRDRGTALAFINATIEKLNSGRMAA